MKMPREERANCILLLLLVAVASATYHHPIHMGQNAKLQYVDTSSAENLTAVYIWGDFQVNVTSRLQMFAPISRRGSEVSLYIVSTISTVRRNKNDLTVSESQLVIPGKYMFERRIPNMEMEIIHAANELIEGTQSSILKPKDLVGLYEAIIEDLMPRINMQNQFSQVRASVTYHLSIVKTAVRLENGTPSRAACPAHQAYDHHGLFACQQEYGRHAERVRESLAHGCKDATCVLERQHSVGRFINEAARGDDAGQPSDVADDTHSMGNNSKLAEEIARLIACGNVTCVEPGCGPWLFNEGWHIYGADWGCCGDYPDCCFLATEVCLIHDAICTCCSFPAFCLDPFCRPDPWCSNSTTTAPP